MNAKVISRSERDEILKARKAILDAWSGGRAESVQTAALIGVCIGHYIPYLLDGVESWQDEAIRLQGELEERDAQSPAE